jgi:hypothetical protein
VLSYTDAPRMLESAISSRMIAYEGRILNVVCRYQRILTLAAITG